MQYTQIENKRILTRRCEFLSGVETWFRNEFAIFNAFSIWHFGTPQIPPTLFGANLWESDFKITVLRLV